VANNSSLSQLNSDKNNKTTELNSINFNNKLFGIIGYNINNPYIIFCYIITLSSLIGIPPLAGFYGKYYMIISGLYSGYILSTIILVLVSGITAYYYSFIISLISFKIYNNRKNILNYNINKSLIINNTNTIKLTYIISYIISLITFILLLPLLLLDIYTNGSTILDYYQYII
jgi:NADH:ubiquinone oxidoreductase subunit 2 (subunit N)